MNHIICFEHQYLKKDTDIHGVCFDWLAENFSHVLSLTMYRGAIALKASQYIGVICTPGNTALEILPKIFAETADDITQNRQWLQDTINEHFLALGKLQQAQASQPNTQVTSPKQQTLPIQQWLISKFLQLCHQVYASGMTSTYHQHEQNNSFVRGKININRQIRDNHAKSRHQMVAQHTDERNNNTCENIILTHALFALHSSGINTKNLYSSFSSALTPALPAISQHSFKQYVQAHYTRDKQQLAKQKLTTPYTHALALAYLIIENFKPSYGMHQSVGYSLLFDMNTLFEHMVAKSLLTKLHNDSATDQQLHAQFNGGALAQHNAVQLFKIRPDIVITQEGRIHSIYDCKWKVLGAQAVRDIAQQDFYQMLAYAHKLFAYTRVDGNNHKQSQNQNQCQTLIQQLVLVYPKTKHFTYALTITIEASDIQLIVMPFDMQEQELVTS